MALPKELSDVLKKVPFDIIAFFLFSMTVVTLSFYLRLDFNKELKTSLMPYTGWGFGRGYMFLLFFVPLILFSSKTTESKTLAILRVFILISMLMECFNGVQDYIQITPEDYTNPNPYLRYDTLTPVYTIAVPFFWSLLMTIALVRFYLKNKEDKKRDTPSAA